jgi:tetratricopeptide (TPR) repeat protein
MADEDDLHLDRKLLLGAYRGEIPLDFIHELGMKHLLELCPHCRREVRAFQANADPERRSVHVFNMALKRRLADLKRQHRKAERELRDLLVLAPEERVPAIRRARRRFKGGHLALLCLEASEKLFTRDPKAAEHLADVARAVIHHSPAASAAMGLLALATAYRANALRAGGDLQGAHAQFKETRAIVQHYFVTDSEMLARIDELEGSLRKDQRHFDQSEDLFTRAVMLYRMAGRPVEIARVRIKLGALYYVQYRLWPAIEVTASALGDLDSELHPRLYLMARYNLTLQLAEADRTEEAAALLESGRELYDQFPEPWTQLRLLCVRAKIADARGDVDTAAQLYGEARDGFIRQGIGYDVAIVSLELATIYLKQGRNAEVRQLAEEMHPLFEAEGVHREAMAALLLFQNAAREDAATIELVKDLTDYLKRARQNPALQFRRVE